MVRFVSSRPIEPSGNPRGVGEEGGGRGGHRIEAGWRGGARLLAYSNKHPPITLKMDSVRSHFSSSLLPAPIALRMDSISPPPGIPDGSTMMSEDAAIRQVLLIAEAHNSTSGRSVEETVLHGAEQFDNESYCLCAKRPCAYASKSKGCRNGSECDFCHAKHRPKNAVDRPSRKYRNKCKEIVDDFLVKGADQRTLLALAGCRPYIKRLLKQHLATAGDQVSQAFPLALPPVRGPLPPGLIKIENSPPLSQSELPVELIKIENSSPLCRSEDAAADCSEGIERDPHRVLSRFIGSRLQWPGTGKQSPAQSDADHKDENSDDDGSMTQSEMAFELELRACVACCL